MTDADRIAYLAGDQAAVDPADAAELDDVRALLADPAMWEQPDPHLEDTVVVTIAGAARSAGPVAGRKRTRRPILLWAAGAAAAAVIAIAVAIGIGSGNGTPATTFSVALGGTSLAPAASGQATLTQTNAGWKITLHVSGLPRLDNGRFYEAWLKNPADVLVPVGTFNQSGDITLWAGVPPTEFPTLTVTRQRANGNQASSGQRVLVGLAHRTS
ncbi:MAG TPA: anti-sigma factor [Streptosporangiaceae bacterium]|nr:anti-sigma factor [Streptosporangiaceae bacterium]